MPTTYAHYRLGDEVAKKLPASAKETVSAYRGLFDIGVHGPDIFFYHNPILKSDLVRLGEQMHHESGAKFFKRAAAIVRKSDKKEAHKAYLYGFLCHFAMDVTCHGYIGEMIEKTQQDKIFEQGFTTKKDGWGIGLSVCKKFIGSQFGTFELAKSDENETIFTLKLPLVQTR